MQEIPKRIEAELRLLDLIDNEGMARPDQIVHEDESILFVWHDRKLVVIVDPDTEDVNKLDYDEAAEEHCPGLRHGLPRF